MDKLTPSSPPLVPSGFYSKFSKLSLGKSAETTREAARLFNIDVMNAEGHHDINKIDKSLKDMLRSMKISVLNYKNEADSSASCSEFIEIAGDVLDAVYNMYHNLGHEKMFELILAEYGENSLTVDSFKVYLLGYYTRPSLPLSEEKTDPSLRIRLPRVVADEARPSRETLRGIPAPASKPTLRGMHAVRPPYEGGVLETPAAQEIFEEPTNPVFPIRQFLPQDLSAPSSLGELGEYLNRGPSNQTEIEDEPTVDGNTALDSALSDLITRTAFDQEVTTTSSVPADLAAMDLNDNPPATPIDYSDEENTNPRFHVGLLVDAHHAVQNNPDGTPRTPSPLPPKPETIVYGPASSDEQVAPSRKSHPAIENPGNVVSELIVMNAPVNLQPADNVPLEKVQISPQIAEDIETNSRRSQPTIPEGNFNHEADLPPLFTSAGNKARGIENHPGNISSDESDERKRITIPPAARGIAIRTRNLVFGTLLAMGAFGTAAYVAVKSQNTEAPTSSTSSSAAPSAKPVSSVKTMEAPAPKIEEEIKNYERGVYRVDTKTTQFKKYLTTFGNATGMIEYVKDFSSQASVRFEGNPAELKKAKESGKNVLSGKETDLQLRLAMAEQILEIATTQNIQNRFVTRFFQTQKEGIKIFKETGSWTSKGKTYDDAEQFFKAIQTPVKYAAPPHVVTYAPDIDIEKNPELKNLKKAAPTYEHIFELVGKQMQDERDPSKIIQYRSFEHIKAGVCSRIDKVVPTLKTQDERDGVAFVNRAFCAPSNPNNPLNKALRQVVEISEEPTAPTKIQGTSPSSPTSPTNNNIHLNRINLNDAPSEKSTPKPAGTFGYNHLKPAEAAPAQMASTAQPEIVKPTTVPKAQPLPSAQTENTKSGLLARTFSKVKSWFGMGSSEKTPSVVAKTETVKTPVITEAAYTKKDIPMYSVREQIKNFLWG